MLTRYLSLIVCELMAYLFSLSLRSITMGLISSSTALPPFYLQGVRAVTLLATRGRSSWMILIGILLNLGIKLLTRMSLRARFNPRVGMIVMKLSVLIIRWATRIARPNASLRLPPRLLISGPPRSSRSLRLPHPPPGSPAARSATRRRQRRPSFSARLIGRGAGQGGGSRIRAPVRRRRRKYTFCKKILGASRLRWMILRGHGHLRRKASANLALGASAVAAQRPAMVSRSA